MDPSEREAKQARLEQLRTQVRQLENELRQEPQAPWRPSGYYTAYYATTGFMLGGFAAAASLLLNVIGALVAGKHPLELIRVYLTFPLGERALSLNIEQEGGLALAIGCCLYLATGMILGVPFYLLLTRFAGGASLIKRLLLATVFSVGIWLVNFYGILSWLQPLLFDGNWIVRDIPEVVALLTHLAFGLTMALLYPLGLYQPYRLQTESL